MSDIRSYQTAEGLSDEQMAELLSDKLGRAISVNGYKIVKSRKDAPAEWLQSLGVAPQEPTYTPDSGDAAPADGPPVDGDAPDMNQRDKPARTAPVASPLPFEPATAAMQLTLIYTMAGKGAATALRCPPVAEVWAQHAPQIANAYIEWARHNATVANYIATLTLGGPAGQVLLLHGSMLVTTLIVAGKLDPERFVPPPPGQETDLIDEQGAADGDATAPPRAKPKQRRRSSAAGSVRGVE